MAAAIRARDREVARWRLVSSSGSRSATPTGAQGDRSRGCDDGPLTRTEAGTRRRGGVELNTQTRMHIVTWRSRPASPAWARIGAGNLPGPAPGLAREVLPPFDHEEALPSSPGAICAPSRPRPTETSPTGPGWRCARSVPGSRRSPGEIEEVRVGEETMLASSRRSSSGAPRGPGANARQLRHLPARLEGPEFSVAGEHAVHVKDGGGGWIRPVIVEDGAVIGAGARSQGRSDRDLAQPLRRRSAKRLGAAIEAEVEDIERFEGMEVTIS